MSLNDLGDLDMTLAWWPLPQDLTLGSRSPEPEAEFVELGSGKRARVESPEPVVDFVGSSGSKMDMVIPEDADGKASWFGFCN